MYPKHLFRSPGPYGKGARTYAVAGAADSDEEVALIEKGWHLTVEAAWGVAKASELVEAVAEANDALDDVSPVTRAELEQKARELGLRFHPNIGDERLAERIAEALA